VGGGEVGGGVLVERGFVVVMLMLTLMGDELSVYFHPLTYFT
jgi:hypothetical protein